MQEWVKKSDVIELLSLPPDILADHIYELPSMYIDDDLSDDNISVYDGGIKLKPCPFCGGKAEFDTFHDIITDVYSLCIRCVDCNAQTMEVSCGITFEQPRPIFDPRVGLAERWNHRKG